MPASVIGISLNLGYPGNVSRNDPKTTIMNRPVGGAASVLFGVPVKLNAANTYDTMIGTDAATAFGGIALRNVKQQTVYASNASGQYNQNEPCDVLTVGYVTVNVNPSAAITAGAAVYAIFDHTTHAFKYFDVATGDGTTTDGVLLPGAQWATGSGPDANGVAELALLTPAKA